MRFTPFFLPLLWLVACGGSSRDLSSDGRGGRGGSGDTGGSGGTGGTRAGTAGTSGTGGTAVGTGGAPTLGGTGGDAGEGGEAAGGGGTTGATGGTGAQGGSDPTGGSGGSGATPSITSCTEEFRFVGTWEGSVLDFYFEPIETLRLVVTPNEELGEGYEATLTFGSGDPPPPVTSGDEPYPDQEFWNGVDDIGGPSSIDLWPGFAHSIVRGAGCDAVLRLSISSAQPWDAWCALQEPVFTAGYGWDCAYQGGGSLSSQGCQIQDQSGRPLADYPPWRCFACGFSGPGVCGCDASGCSFNREPTHTFELQGGVGDVISGPDPRCGDCTVRLERVQ